MWSILRNIPKFTTKSSIDTAIGKPKFQLEDRPVYYYGNGILVYYSAKCFRIEGIERKEYGVPDEYAIGLFHFSNIDSLKKLWDLKPLTQMMYPNSVMILLMELLPTILLLRMCITGQLPMDLTIITKAYSRYWLMEKWNFLTRLYNMDSMSYIFTENQKRQK